MFFAEDDVGQPEQGNLLTGSVIQEQVVAPADSEITNLIKELTKKIDVLLKEATSSRCDVALDFSKIKDRTDFLKTEETQNLNSTRLAQYQELLKAAEFTTKDKNWYGDPQKLGEAFSALRWAIADNATDKKELHDYAIKIIQTMNPPALRAMFQNINLGDENSQKFYQALLSRESYKNDANKTDKRVKFALDDCKVDVIGKYILESLHHNKISGRDRKISSDVMKENIVKFMQCIYGDSYDAQMFSEQVDRTIRKCEEKFNRNETMHQIKKYIKKICMGLFNLQKEKHEQLNINGVNIKDVIKYIKARKADPIPPVSTIISKNQNGRKRDI